ncbi:MAG: hypothetical protein K6T83_11570 [Alicyclobacillus sp.]|nr:hypothetical protein [Alicyclobacillus sp.]
MPTINWIGQIRERIVTELDCAGAEQLRLLDVRQFAYGKLFPYLGGFLPVV